MWREQIEKAFKTGSGRWSSKLIKAPPNSALMDQLKGEYPDLTPDQAIWCAYNNVKEPKKCHCGANLIFYGLAKGYSQFCSLSCAGRSTASAALITKNKNGTNKNFGSPAFKTAMLEKYGVEHNSKIVATRQKIKEAIQAKYGVSSSLELVQDRTTSQQSPMAKAKRRRTNTERYGAISPMGSKDIREKAELTNLKRYGCRSSLSNQSVRDKANVQKRRAWINYRLSALSHTVKLLSSLDEVNNKNSLLNWECVSCKSMFASDLDDGKTPRCNICNPTLKIGSKLSAALLEVFNKELGSCKVNDRTVLAPLEIDFWFKEKNLGVEVHGLYWHSDAVASDKKEFKKANLAQSAGIRLLQFYEDEVINKPHIVMSIVNSAAAIYGRTIHARKCEVRKIEHREYFNFCEENHLQGGCAASIKYGLFFEQHLVAVIGIAKARFKFGDYEIVRFCQKLNTKIHGAFSKLLIHSTEGLTGILVSYADRRIFTGASYTATGFEFKHETKPGYWYTDFKHRMNRMNFQKHKITSLQQDMIRSGRIAKIYDCGQLVFFKVL